jgi:HlyD family secretion protein
MLADGGWIEVSVELERDASTPTGYAWTASRGPDAILSPGTTAQARATVVQRAPITYVLPILREHVGLD